MDTEIIVTGPNEQEEQPAVYSEFYEAPVHLRTLRGARLSLAQINALVADAYANKVQSGDTFLPDFGGAKRRFEDSHVIEKRFWLDKEINNV